MQGRISNEMKETTNGAGRAQSEAEGRGQKRGFQTLRQKKIRKALSKVSSSKKARAAPPSRVHGGVGVRKPSEVDEDLSFILDEVDEHVPLALIKQFCEPVDEEEKETAKRVQALATDIKICGQKETILLAVAQPAGSKVAYAFVVEGKKRVLALDALGAPTARVKCVYAGKKMRSHYKPLPIGLQADMFGWIPSSFPPSRVGLA